MALTAIISVVAVGAIGAYVSPVILIVAFRDFVFLFVVAGSAILIARHAFHVFASLTFMMAGYAGLAHVLADVYLVVKDHHAPVCIKLDCLGKGRHDTARFLKCKTLADVTGVTDDFHGHGLVAFDAISPDKVRVGLVVALKFPRLSIIVAGAAVHFNAGWNSLVLFIIMMAIIALG